ncbi:MAG: hypothetical protein WA269_14275 [Candidatus Udaeobacter sp.]
MAETQSAHSIAYSRAPLSAWLGIVCLFVLFGIIVLAVIGPSPRTSDYEEARAKKRMEKLKALQEENQKDLTTYEWLDKNKGVARIPIDRAMEVTVADLAQKKPAPAGPIATPAAQTAPAGASAAPAASPQGAAVSSPPAEAAAKAGPPSAIAASPSAATEQSPSAPASPAPATTP